MKKSLFIVLCSCTFIVAQPTKPLSSENRKERIESAKIGMVTNRLNLTTEQAPTFWVIYNDFDDKRRDYRRAIRRLVNEPSLATATDEKIASAQREVLILKQKDLDLEKEYFGKFLKVINIRQYAELQKTERDFNQLLINRLRQQGKPDED